MSSHVVPPPSRYRLPQRCTPDRQRARRATLELQRKSYLLASDSAAGHPREGFRLPVAAAVLPVEDAFDLEKKARLLGHKLVLRARTPIVRARVPARPLDARHYGRLVGWLRHPVAEHDWQSDAAFARERLTGTNPMAIARCHELPENGLAKAADGFLRTRHDTRLNAALDDGRLFRTDYSDLVDDRIQKQVRRGVWLAAPTCLFYLGDDEELVPIAIELMPSGHADHGVLTPLDSPAHWLMARCHAQAADAHYHETVYHLLETHMVTEVFALSAARELHPDHPLSQLLRPHFQDTLAINYLARHDLLSAGGPIDTVLGAGVGGGLDLARIAWSRWSFRERTLEADLARRGLDDAGALPGFLYRDDARAIWKILHQYVGRVLAAWYLGDDDVRSDVELAAWCRDLAGKVPDFPGRVETRGELVTLVTDVVFRASAQHSAVNNGQFQTYGYAPNAPGSVSAPLPRAGEATLDDDDIMRALPDRAHAMAQLGMAWVLSQPTHRSLLTIGEGPAFTREQCPAAYDATRVLRRQLVDQAEAIAARNRERAWDYTYLCPYDVGRSTAV